MMSLVNATGQLVIRDTWFDHFLWIGVYQHFGPWIGLFNRFGGTVTQGVRHGQRQFPR